MGAFSETAIGVSFAEDSFRQSLEALVETTVAVHDAEKVFQKVVKYSEVCIPYQYKPYFKSCQLQKIL